MATSRHRACCLLNVRAAGSSLALPLGSTTRAHHFFCLAEFRDPFSCAQEPSELAGPCNSRASWTLARVVCRWSGNRCRRRAQQRIAFRDATFRFALTGHGRATTVAGAETGEASAALARWSAEPPFAISAISASTYPYPLPLASLSPRGHRPRPLLSPLRSPRHSPSTRAGGAPVLKCETETWERSIDRAKAHRTLVQTVRASWVPHATKVRPSRSDAPHCYLSWAPPARKILSSGDRSFLLSASC